MEDHISKETINDSSNRNIYIVDHIIPLLVKDVVETQKCTKCGKIKSITEFYRLYTGRRTRSQCKQCHHEYTKDWKEKHRKRTCDIAKKWRDNHPEYRKTVRDQQFERSRKFKRELVIIAGGKCIHCGYSKCDGAMEFHHIDRNDKEEFSINSKEDREKLIELIKLGKVILLCANCHREEHWENKSSGRTRNE